MAGKSIVDANLDDYQSEEDEDYAPSEDEDEKKAKKEKKKRKRNDPLQAPTRKGGLKLEGEESEDDDSDDSEEEEEGGEMSAKESAEEQKKKQRIDSLWAELNGGSASAPSRPPTSATAKGVRMKGGEGSKAEAGRSQVVSSTTSSADATVVENEKGKGKEEARPKIDEGKSSRLAAAALALRAAKNRKVESQDRVTVSKTFDYAGEKVTIQTSVKQDSKEARNMKMKEKKKTGTNLDALMDKITNAKSISTVDKSRKDWTEFKQKEGIEDDLKNAAKDGYLAKQDFLLRSEERQHDKYKQELRMAKKSATIAAMRKDQAGAN